MDGFVLLSILIPNCQHLMIKNGCKVFKFLSKHHHNSVRERMKEKESVKGLGFLSAHSCPVELCVCVCVCWADNSVSVHWVSAALI